MVSRYEKNLRVIAAKKALKESSKKKPAPVKEVKPAPKVTKTE